MKSDIVLEQVADVADAVYRRTDEVSILLARAITREVRLYGPTAAVPFEVVAAGCAANMRAIFGAIAAGGDFNVTAATQLGIERARDGVPLSSVMEAYRVGFRRVWEAVATANTLSVIAELVCHYELQGCRFAACQCRMQSGAKELR